MNRPLEAESFCCLCLSLNRMIVALHTPGHHTWKDPRQSPHWINTARYVVMWLSPNLLWQKSRPIPELAEQIQALAEASLSKALGGAGGTIGPHVWKMLWMCPVGWCNMIKSPLHTTYISPRVHVVPFTCSAPRASCVPLHQAVMCWASSRWGWAEHINTHQFWENHSLSARGTTDKLDRVSQILLLQTDSQISKQMLMPSAFLAGDTLVHCVML